MKIKEVGISLDLELEQFFIDSLKKVLLRTPNLNLLEDQLHAHQLQVQYYE